MKYQTVNILGNWILFVSRKKLTLKSLHAVIRFFFLRHTEARNVCKAFYNVVIPCVQLV